MGHDVVNIGRHNLDTKNIEALAKDLSKRFQASVEYGYCKVTSTNEVNSEDRDYSFEDIILGEISFTGATQTLWLHNEYYEIHQLIDQYGTNWNLGCFNDFSKMELNEASKGIYYELFGSRSKKNEIGIIQNNRFIDYYNYFQNRWWRFCRAFSKEDKDGQLMEKVNFYRKKVMERYALIGGSDVIYFSDQGTYMDFYEFYYNWETIYNTLMIRNAETTLNISEFMKHKNLLTEDGYPLAFYDDFADLKNQTGNL